MLLDIPDVALFLRLHRTLMVYVNQRLEAIPDQVSTPDEFAVLSPELRLVVRDALSANVGLIESFVAENPAHLPSDELDIVSSWRHLVVGEFYILRELTKHTVFLSSGKPGIAYGVNALSAPFVDLIRRNLPVVTKTVLLPFKDKIIYDGLLYNYSISFGPGIRRSLNESFKEAKSRFGIVATLPMSDRPMPPKPAKPSPKPPTSEAKNETLNVIIGLIDQFCHENLNEEYAVLCRKLAEKLDRKRPSPLMSGQPKTWACGIVRTVGWVNFLYDKSRNPHMSLTDIDAAFGVAESTGAAKSAAIRKMLKIRHFDPIWTLPSQRGNNPMMWMFRAFGR